MIRHYYRKLAAGFALFTLELIFVMAIFLACVLVFLYVSAEVATAAGPLKFDESAFALAADVQSTGFTQFIEFITFFASRHFMTAAGLMLIAYFLFVRRHKWYSLKVPVVALGSISLNLVLKFFFDRQRPDMPLVDASGLSFPSGHSMVAASFYSLLIYLVWHHVQSKPLRHFLVALLVIFILLIGFSRIYLRVHFATDVVAGFAAGILWVIVGIGALRRLERYTRKEVAPVVEED
ncbi:phosphatase PAP2 family protein [Pontibacter sp. JH31]|uniref:Phosphatase PAP2 family protein n=1 Tax=Pontibacter aquaedesilientis TaxID=2766980 RepID=A0ABR7XF48_9BACT|nr:phosphatase PAP2 family protein [Pontibacter aquaedesilientis]MBD1396922.1 phosphatase PAP2 family protein [Pontibacter aquaedesilientis]